MQVIDCFIFNNEIELLLLRISILSGVVDKFIIVEQTVTHQGLQKELNFCKIKKEFPEFWNKYKNKIYYLVDTTTSKIVTDNPWVRENNNRTELIKPLLLSGKINDEDIIFLSDVDEFWNPIKIDEIKEKINNNANHKVISCEQYLSYYYLNFRHKLMAVSFFNTKIINYWMIKNIFNNDLQLVRHETDPNKIEYIYNCGWHFSYVMGNSGINRIKNKLESFSHAEYNKEEYKNDEHLLSVIESGKDLLNRGEFTYVKTEIDETFPIFVQEHKEELIKSGLIKL